MPPPTHPRSCVTLTCHPQKCSKCEERVFYFSCTCGSKVFFDTLFPDWWQHECVEYEPPAAPQGIEPLLVVCPRCGSRVSPDRLSRHPRKSKRTRSVAALQVEDSVYPVWEALSEWEYCQSCETCSFPNVVHA